MNSSGPSVFLCHICHEIYNSLEEITNHFSEKHPHSPSNSVQSTPVPPEIRCENCSQVFKQKRYLASHIKNKKCNARKRKRKTPHSENPPRVEKPPKRFRWDEENNEQECPKFFLDENPQSVYEQNWHSIRSHSSQGNNQLMFNLRWQSFLAPNWSESLNPIFLQQKRRFKINFSHSFILYNQEQDQYRFFHACQNNARGLDYPVLINNQGDFENFLKVLENQDILEQARQQRPDSKWSVFSVVSTSFYINPLPNHPIGCCDSPLPEVIKSNPHVFGLDKNRKNGEEYSDNLCLFRCLAIHQNGGEIDGVEKKTKELARVWGVDDLKKFGGVMLSELEQFEKKFGVSINVYEVEEGTGYFVSSQRSSNKAETNTLCVLMYKNHFCYISDINLATRSFVCGKCGHVGSRDYYMKKHEEQCSGVHIQHIYPGGVYHVGRSTLEILKDNGIKVPEGYIYPYRATYDFESILAPVAPGEKKQTEHTQYTTKHIPVSVSVCSNVPGFDKPACFVSSDEQDPQGLVDQMIDYLEEISDHAFQLLQNDFRDVYQQISELKDEPHLEMSPQKLASELDNFLQELPVIGFNSSVYDLNLIKPAFFQNITSNPAPSVDGDKKSPIKFLIKNNNEYKCVSTQKFKFLDIKNYIAPGFSYAKYLAAYDIDQNKGFFPYEYLTSLDKLDETQLPSKEAFYSSLKEEHISDQDYEYCQQIWVEENMKTVKDFLIWYNNLDVTPFLKAVEKQSQFYCSLKLDMFKDGVGIPGLTLKYLFQTLPPEVYFGLINNKNSDLHKLLREQMVGGPSLIFHRYHEKDKTYIRGSDELVKSIIGFDANALYLWALSQPMPTEHPIRRHRDPHGGAGGGFRPQKTDHYGQKAREWLEWEAQKSGEFIRHKFNGRERQLGGRHIRVDGWCGDKKKAYQFHGCVFHGHLNCHLTQGRSHHPYDENKSFEDLYKKTAEITSYLRDEVKVEVVEMWECEWEKLKQNNKELRRFIFSRFPPYKSPFPWGKEINESIILELVLSGRLFGLVQCDISVPPHLEEHFSELQPIFKNTLISTDDIGPFMAQYAKEHKILTQPRRTLVASYWGKGVLLITPLLRWYLEHGLEVTNIQQIVEFKGVACFRDFADQVSKARREGDADPNKQILADSFKLIGNSAYGKTLTNLEKHNNVEYVHPDLVETFIKNPLFKKTTPLSSELQEVECGKSKVRWSLPNQIGFFVYQYAKLRMLMFHYDLVDRFIPRSKYQLCEMDTDSLYLALGGEDITHIIKPGLEKEFFENYENWFPAQVCPKHKEDFVFNKLKDKTWKPPKRPCCDIEKAFNKRSPGLFKEEYRGEGIVALCSKTYYCFGGYDKYSSKGLSKKLNNLTRDSYLEVLTTKKSGGGVNKSFRSDGVAIYTYQQQRKSLSFFYPKRIVQDDGVSTKPTRV